VVSEPTGQLPAPAGTPGPGIERPHPTGQPDRIERLEQVEQALASARLGTLRWDVRTDVLTWDDRACTVLGVEPGCLTRGIASLWDLVLHEDVAAAQEAVRAAVEGTGEYALECRVRRADGSVRWVESRGRVLPGPDGRAAQLVGVVMDSTELRSGHDPSSRELGNDRTAFRAAARLAELGEATRPEQARRVLAYTAALAEADSLPDVIDTVATMVLPAFGATGMLVSLLESGRLKLAGHTGYGPPAVKLLDVLDVEDNAPIAQVMRSREPLFLSSRQAYLRLFPGRKELVDTTGKHAWVFLPLTVSGRALGTLTISFDEPRRLAPDERSLLVSVGGLIAQTFARARLRDLERTLAAELQAQLLPRALPEPVGLSARARYLPATDGMGVGGDWYDVLELPGQRIGLVIGDVQGHNMRAAAVMGQLRNALRAYAAEGHEPAAVLSRTNRLMSDLDPTLFATCCYLVLDLRTSTATLALAGHPPPLLRQPDGQVTTLSAPVGPPLGVAPEDEYLTREVALAAGAVVVLYTDGLVEDSRRTLDEGLAGLTDVLQESDVDDLDLLVDSLVAVAVDTGHRSDDIATLVVRHDGLLESERPINARTMVDRADPRAARSARDFIAGFLSAPELVDVRDNCVLLVSEVVTNALRHTDGEVSLELWRFPRWLRVEVADETSRGPVAELHDPLDDSGRGVPLMDALSDRWGTAPHGDGKVVWFELDLPT
jgi:anti-sigma regulatory factor (Ser/Thr protein kinase)